MPNRTSLWFLDDMHLSLKSLLNISNKHTVKGISIKKVFQERVYEPQLQGRLSGKNTRGILLDDCACLISAEGTRLLN